MSDGRCHKSYRHSWRYSLRAKSNSHTPPCSVASAQQYAHGPLPMLAEKAETVGVDFETTFSTLTAGGGLGGGGAGGTAGTGVSGTPGAGGTATGGMPQIGGPGGGGGTGVSGAGGNTGMGGAGAASGVLASTPVSTAGNPGRLYGGGGSGGMYGGTGGAGAAGAIFITEFY